MHPHWLEIFSYNPKTSYLVPHNTTENAVAKAIGTKETILQTVNNFGEFVRRTIKKIPNPQHLENLYPRQKK